MEPRAAGDRIQYDSFDGVDDLWVAIALAVLVWLIRAVRELDAARRHLAAQAVIVERQRIDNEVASTLGAALEQIVARGEAALALAETASGQCAADVSALTAQSRDTLARTRALLSGYREPARVRAGGRRPRRRADHQAEPAGRERARRGGGVTTPFWAPRSPWRAILLPFLSSGFVPAGSMSPGLRQFAEYQPFTPVSETVRGLLLGTPIGTDWIQAVGWCAALTVVGYVASRRLFGRHTSA